MDMEVASKELDETKKFTCESICKINTISQKFEFEIFPANIVYQLFSV